MPTEDRRPKVVIDTNVFVSGLNFAGRPSEILELLMKGEIEGFISSFILTELERILRERFEWKAEQLHRVLNRIKTKTILVHPKIRISVIKEKDDDNRILECAVEAKVEYLVSGDRKHLLPLRDYQGVKILSSAEFMHTVFAR
jgi:putative PIN family toxin of toxin-antitoxin system